MEKEHKWRKQIKNKTNSSSKHAHGWPERESYQPAPNRSLNWGDDQNRSNPEDNNNYRIPSLVEKLLKQINT